MLCLATLASGTHLLQFLLCFNRAKALISIKNEDLVTFFQAFGETPGMVGHVLFFAIGGQRYAHHQCTGLPLADALINGLPVGCAIVIIDNAQRAGRTSQTIANGHPDPFGAVVEAQVVASGCGLMVVQCWQVLAFLDVKASAITWRNKPEVHG